jgi:hypothetical protein
MLEKPINIILHVMINYNNFKEDYQKKFLEAINLMEIRKKLSIPDTDKLIFNGGWYRNFYYLAHGNILRHTKIYIRKLCWVTDKESHYISVWPDFVIKYNPLSIDLIEYLVKKVRNGEDIFLEKHIHDPELLIQCEDLIHKYCQLLELTCRDKPFSATLNAFQTEKYNSVLNVDVDREFLNKFRYPNIYILIKTGQAYQGSSGMVLSFLNRKFKFLR